MRGSYNYHSEHTCNFPTKIGMLSGEYDLGDCVNFCNELDRCSAFSFDAITVGGDENALENKITTLGKCRVKLTLIICFLFFF